MPLSTLLTVVVTVVICYTLQVSAFGNTEGKNLTEGVREFNIILATHHQHIMVVRDLLRETDLEAQKQSIVKCIFASGAVGRFRVNIRQASNAAEQLFGKSKDLTEQWKEIPSLIDQLVGSGQLELALPMFDTSMELLQDRDKYLSTVIQSSKSLRHTEWKDSANYFDGRSDTLSRILMLFAVMLLSSALFIPSHRGLFAGAALVVFFFSVILLKWEILSHGKCAPVLQSKIRELLEIIETRKSEFESASDTLEGLHTALQRSIHANGNITAISTVLAIQAEFIDSSHVRESYRLLQLAQREITSQVSSIRRLNRNNIYGKLLENLIILEKTYPLMIQNVSTFLIQGHAYVEHMIKTLPVIQNFVEVLRFDLAQWFLSQIHENMLDIKNNADVHKDSINTLVESLIVFRGKVDEETGGRQQDVDSAGDNKLAGYVSGVVSGTAATASCIQTAGISCAVTAAVAVVSFFNAAYYSRQEAELQKHVQALERMSSYICELDKFLQSKAAKMNEIYGQSDTALKRMNGLDRSINMVRKISFTPVLTKPAKQVLDHSIRLILESLKKNKKLIIELNEEINQRYLAR